MNKINKARDGVVNRFTQLMSELFSSDLFNEINELDGLITKKTTELSDLKELYRGLEIKYINLNSAFSNRQSEMSNYEKSLSDRELIISSKESTIDEKIKKAEDRVLNAVASRDSIIKEIESLLPELEKLQSVKKDKELLLSEIANLKSYISAGNKKLDSINDEYSHVVSEINVARMNWENELRALRLEKDKELQSVIPTIQKLAAKEKLLNEREIGFDIIEARWKKLYADKGVGFKV